MARNPNFQRALASLSHPVSLAAAAVLLLNAAWLEPYHPSWFSGKIGDLAWMLIGPLVLAALLAGLIPPRWRHSRRAVGLASLLLFALGYTLIKAWPPANALVRALGERAGVPLKLTLDAGDLLLLPGLLGAYVLWRHTPVAPVDQNSWCRWRWAGLGLCVLALVADAPAPRPPDPAFSCLVQEGAAVLDYQGLTRYSSSGSQELELHVYASADGGLSWTSLAAWQTGRVKQTPVPGQPGPSLDRLAAIRDSCPAVESNPTVRDPAHPDIVYQVRNDGVFRSQDGGRTFNQEVALQGARGALIDASSGNLIVRSQVPGVVWNVDEAVRLVIRTPDGAYHTASPASQPIPGFVGALVADAQTPGTLYVATTACGVCTSTDGGAHWRMTGAGLAGSVRALAIDPRAPATIYAGTDRNPYVYKSTDGGAHFSPAGDGLAVWADAAHSHTGFITSPALLIDSQQPATLYAGLYGGVFKSTDGGDHWQWASTGPTTTVTALASDPQMPATLYAATVGHGVYKSTDGSLSWSPASSGLPDAYVTGQVLALDPHAPAVLYLGTDSGLYKSTDGGAHWRAASAGLSAGAGSDVNLLAIDLQTPTTLYAGQRDRGVFRSADGGAHWSAASTSLTGAVLALAVDPSAPGTLYAGTDTSPFVYKSTDGGAHWSPAGTGLPNPHLNALPTLAPATGGAPGLGGPGTSVPARPATPAS